MSPKLLAFALAALACTALAQDDAAESHVLVLTDENLESTIQENEFILVEFYAPWCGHCQSLEPEYEQAAATLAARDTPIPLAKVDATENEQSAMQYEIEGFPTLKWFVGGSAIEYDGGRTAGDIVAWVEKMTGPPCTALASDADVTAFKASAGVVVVAAVEDGSETLKIVENAARRVKVPVGLVTDAALAALPSLKLYKDGDEVEMDLAGADGLDAEAIAAFINANALPLVSVFSQESAQQIFGSEIDNHFLYFNAADAADHAAHMETLAGVAKEFVGKTLFVHVPSSEEPVLEFFGLGEGDLPAALLVSLSDQMATYRMSTELTADNVRAHVEGYHAGTLERTVKSEEIPEDNSGPVTVVVGKSFDDIVLNPETTVFLEVYAPWCGHCKALAPDYEKLGEHFANEPSVVIAKMDGTANEISHPGVQVEGFPTLLLFPKGADAEPVVYEEYDRSLEAMIAFVSQHAGLDAGAGAEAAVEAGAVEDKDEL